jgi:hypothetical protein
MTASSATETFQQGVQNLQAWLDFLDEEEGKFQAQLSKMQGGTALPEIEADAPHLDEEFLGDLPDMDSDEEVDKWA